jgi:hypothetical protein
MKKIVFIILFSNFLVINVFAQNANIYYLTSNGKTNYVIHLLEKNKFYSYSSIEVHGKLRETDDPDALVEVKLQNKGNELVYNIKDFKTYTYKKMLEVAYFQSSIKDGAESIYTCKAPQTYFYFSNNTYPDGVVLKIISTDAKKNITKVNDIENYPDDSWELAVTPTSITRKNKNGEIKVYQLKK